MPRRIGGSRSARHAVDCDLELRPLMNVFIVLIPMLLMSAVFMEIRVIEMQQPHGGAPAAEPAASAPLELALRVHGGTYVVTGSGMLPMTFARHPLTGASEAIDAGTAAQLSAALAQVVAAHPANREIRIVAEAGTRYQEIVSLMDLARAAGLPDAALVGTVSEGA